MRTRGSSALWWAGVILLAAEPAHALCKPKPLSEIVREYHARNLSPIEAVFALGQAAEICFGFEVTDEALLGSRVDLDRYGSSTGALLAEILSPAPHLEAVELGALVLVRRRTRPAYNWLDFIVPEFRSRQADVQSVSNLIYMTMARAVEPALQGFAGSYPAGDPEDVIGPFDEKGMTVRELLCLMVANSRGGMWVVEGGTAFERSRPRKPFWTVIQYAQPRETVVERLKRLTVSPPFRE